jgi:putative heme degradation protein
MPMLEFVTGLTQRIRETKARLQGAMIAEDSYAVQVEQGDLDNLLRIAANHHVEVVEFNDLRRAA